MSNKNDWFASWFDTSYYHTLYKSRDYKEAEEFIKILSSHLQIPRQSRLLDLACGKGRHSITLNSLGFDVTGVDLSKESIDEASKASNDTLNFAVKDMRYPFELGKFDFILNLFTSFGYFDNNEDNINTLQNVRDALHPKGVFVIDFMNAKKIIGELVPTETKSIDGIDFNITREVKDGQIYKNISFTDKNRNFDFQERVQALTENDFDEYFRKVGLRTVEKFGNYALESFDEHLSDRLIIVAQNS